MSLQVKNVDNDIIAFKDKLLALQLSYDRLDATLKDNTILSAARAADEYAGDNLWSQTFTILRGCQNRILGLRQTLQNIEYVSRRISSILKHLAEALTNGELVVMKDVIDLLEQSISFPVTMINISLALQQTYLHEIAQNGAVRSITTLKSDYNKFSSQLERLLCSPRSAEHEILLHMHSFGNAVNTFVYNAAVSLSQASAANPQPVTMYIPHQDAIQPAEHARWSQEDASTTHTAESYDEVMQATPNASSLPLTPRHDLNAYVQEGANDIDNEIELELTMEYMANGQADLETDDLAGAEENFRRALEMAGEHNLSTRLTYGPGHITLMLADCLMQQEKEEDALELLEPVADGTAAFVKSDEALPQASIPKQGLEYGLQFKASHILAVVFLKRLDLQAAEKRAKEAFKGRRGLLGAQHPLTLESVQLIIDIYIAKDDKTNARAYRRFLEPSGKSRHAAGPGNPQVGLAPQPALVNDTSGTSRTMIPASASATSYSTDAAAETSLPTKFVTVRDTPPVTSTSLQTHDATTRPTQTSGGAPTAHLHPVNGQYGSHDGQGGLLPFPHPNDAVRSPPTLPQTSASQSQVLSTHGTALTQTDEYGTTQNTCSPSGAKQLVPVAPLQPNIEPDPLPANIGITSRTSRKTSWSNPFSRSSTNKADASSSRKLRKDSSESVTEDASRNSSATGILSLDHKRQLSLAGSFDFDARSFYSKSSDYGDEKVPHPSIASRSFSAAAPTPARTRQELVPMFSAIKTLRQEGKKNAAIESAMKLLKEYDPDRKVLIVRETELKKNMRESHKGMAGTGYGYAPIHFFCERKVEANVEVELLIGQGVDVNAVACKAGLPGTDPFTPLQRAVELGHAEIVRLLIEADVAIAPPRPQKGTSSVGGKDKINQPLLLACTKGHTEITFALLTAGAGKVLKEFPQRQWHGNSLLHEACWLANTEMVKMLLDYSRNLKEQHRQSTSGQPDYESGVIGSLGQQDQFGATPIMYAIDLRDCTNDTMRALKTAKRKDCLRLLLEHAVNGDTHSQMYRETVARMLSLKWTKGPGAGHSIFCYADEAGDDELTGLLDPYRYRVSPGMRCSATPQCSNTVKIHVLGDGNPHRGQGSGRTVWLPSFPELMSTPVEYPRDGMHGTPPPSFESAVGCMSPSSPTLRHQRAVSNSLTSATGSVIDSDRSTNFS
ncbi:hypothetical protein OHC33_006825 [Knufia fluminis]|uniref:Ankyrin repeat protein n=1 Tax=Knufia fluminis TaxID=191047 RepID=A0AAN8EC16_9EURO|nr:hypothetical protein OHC33_006825 [Knufia fluminis]